MENPRRQFTRIKGLSEIRRLPRLGKIRLGIKATNKTGKEYPQETDYFVCPPEIREVYGEEPKELEIMFPVNDPEIIFPQRLAWFGSSKGIKCMGNGESAMRYEESGQRLSEPKEVECPCDQLENGCSRKAHLLFMLPRVNMGGVYQIDTESYFSIVNINSSLALIEALIGKISFIPLKLKRVLTGTYGSGKKETHHILNLFFEGNIDFVNQLRETNQKQQALLQYVIPEAEIEDSSLDDVPTEEEAKRALEERGMIPEEEIAPEGAPEKIKEEKINEAKILNQAAQAIAKVTIEKDLYKWFNEFKKTPGLSSMVISQSIILVNEKIQKLREAGQRYPN